MNVPGSQALAYEIPTMPSLPSFPLDQWYVAALGWQLTDKPVARTLLNKPVVLFRTSDGKVAALEDRCCHRALPLSNGTLEDQGLRCGYHGLLFNGEGRCIEIPGQDKIPGKARVPAYHVRERDRIVWIWFGSSEHPEPICEPPAYDVHSSGEYLFDGDVYHYDAPYQLIHDNLMDLSHLGYVHLRTIGGNASIHMNAEMKVERSFGHGHPPYAGLHCAPHLPGRLPLQGPYRSLATDRVSRQPSAHLDWRGRCRHRRSE